MMLNPTERIFLTLSVITIVILLVIVITGQVCDRLRRPRLGLQSTVQRSPLYTNDLAASQIPVVAFLDRTNNNQNVRHLINQLQNAANTRGADSDGEEIYAQVEIPDSPRSVSPPVQADEIAP